MAFALFQFRNDVLIIHEHGNGSDGDAEENSHHAEDTAAHDDGNENQDTGYSQLIAVETRLDDVSVDGLKNEREDHEHQHFRVRGRR